MGRGENDAEGKSHFDQWYDYDDALETAETEYKTAKANYENNEAEIVRLSNELGDAQEETGMPTGEMEAMTSVTDDLTASMDALGVAYTEAYEAAYDSISGQYALWDTAADVVAMDADAVMAALKSQEAYCLRKAGSHGRPL